MNVVPKGGGRVVRWLPCPERGELVVCDDRGPMAALDLLSGAPTRSRLLQPPPLALHAWGRWTVAVYADVVRVLDGRLADIELLPTAARAAASDDGKTAAAASAAVAPASPSSPRWPGAPSFLPVDARVAFLLRGGAVSKLTAGPGRAVSVVPTAADGLPPGTVLARIAGVPAAVMPGDAAIVLPTCGGDASAALPETGVAFGPPVVPPWDVDGSTLVVADAHAVWLVSHVEIGRAHV